MRICFGLLAAVLLGGCSNLVTSETPWFLPADRAAAHAFRDGLWAVSDPECHFESRTPVQRWPDCARAVVIRPGEALQLSVSPTNGGDRTRPGYDWSRTEIVLVGGDPQIEQIEGCPRPATPEQTSDTPAMEGDPPVAPAVDKPPAAPSTTHRYCYAAVEPIAIDPNGRIIAYVTWPVFCGPWPSDDAGSPVTRAPFPGLHVEDYDCTADSVAALRYAARASKAISPQQAKVEFHWVRDRYW